MAGSRKIEPWMLLGIPAGTYAASYLYLAAYHGRINLLSTVIHENGELTFLETVFYASHFLGHLTVHTTLAFFFAGSLLCLSPSDSKPAHKGGSYFLLACVVVYLALCLGLSLAWFGVEDTWSFFTLQKQRPDLYVAGGSWNLHLASTTLMLLFIPGYLVSAIAVWKRPLSINRSGRWLWLTGLGLFVLVTILANENPFQTLAFVWRDPRHLAHSIREIVTFATIYFPIPLYFFLRHTPSERPNVLTVRQKAGLIGVGLVLVAGLFYQALIPLQSGIGGLAQNPGFANGKALSIPYLFSFHFFEHFLDTVYFTLVCLLFWRVGNFRDGKGVIASG